MSPYIKSLHEAYQYYTAMNAWHMAALIKKMIERELK